MIFHLLETYILFMHHHLIPPCIMRATGLKVNNTHRMYCVGPIIDDNCISFKDTYLIIKPQQIRISSYFNTYELLTSELYGKIKCSSHLMQVSWILTACHMPKNELAMTNHKGEIPAHSIHIKVPMQLSDDSYEIFV